MKPDKTIRRIARLIVWLEDLKLEINARRFEIESKRAHSRYKKATVDIIQTKIVDQNGTVITTIKDVVAQR